MTSNYKPTTLAGILLPMFATNASIRLFSQISGVWSLQCQKKKDPCVYK